MHFILYVWIHIYINLCQHALENGIPSVQCYPLPLELPAQYPYFIKKYRNKMKWNGFFTHATRTVLQICLNLGHKIFKSTRQEHCVPEQNDCHSLVPLNRTDLLTPRSYRRWKTHENRQIVTVSLLQMTSCLKNYFFPLRRKNIIKRNLEKPKAN